MTILPNTRFHIRKFYKLLQTTYVDHAVVKKETTEREKDIYHNLNREFGDDASEDFAVLVTEGEVNGVSSLFNMTQPQKCKIQSVKARRGREYEQEQHQQSTSSGNEDNHTEGAPEGKGCADLYSNAPGPAPHQLTTETHSNTVRRSNTFGDSTIKILTEQKAEFNCINDPYLWNQQSATRNKEQ